MAETKYTYSIATDFPHAKVATSRLTQEIQTASLSIALDYINTSGDDCDIWFRDELTGGDQTILDGLVAAHSGAPLADTRTEDGKPIVALDTLQKNKAALVAIAPLEGSETIYSTHNFCDKTTWYSESVRVTSEALTDAGAGTVWNSAHTFWIDLTSGKVQDETGIIDEEAVRTPGHHGWGVVVTSDAVELTMREPLEESGGDYWVDYEAGTIHFVSSQAGKTVLASYSYAGSSGWRLTAVPNRILQITDAEAQFSTSIVMTDTLVFQVTGPIEFFAPQLMEANGGPYPDDTRIPLTTTTYKRFSQLVDEARGAYPVIPAIGGSARGTSDPIYGFPFLYGASRDLKASLQVELWIRLAHDRPFEGERATATFYCLSLTEPS